MENLLKSGKFSKSSFPCFSFASVELWMQWEVRNPRGNNFLVILLTSTVFKTLEIRAADIFLILVIVL